MKTTFQNNIKQGNNALSKLDKRDVHFSSRFWFIKIKELEYLSGKNITIDNPN